MKETTKGYINEENPVQYFISFEYLKPFFKNKKVLDLGCGTGEYLQRFGKDSIGVDISKYNIKKCREKGLKIEIHDLNQKLPFKKDEFETVFCSHVLEHVDSPINLLREINRVVQPGGYIIIGLPIENSLPTLILDDYFRKHQGHLYSFSLNNLRQLYKKTGFKPINIFFDLNLVKRLGIGFILPAVNLLPKSILTKISPAFWCIGKKY